MKQGNLRSLAQCFLLALGATIAGCGGGGDATQASGTQIMSMPGLESANVGSEFCTKDALAEGTFQWVEGRCVRGSTALRMAPLSAKVVSQATSLTPDILMDWAEINYPQYFAPSSQKTQFFNPYTYRYYPETKNHLGIAGQDIYVLGPMSGNQLARVGSMGDFVCSVLPNSCAVPGAPVIVSATPGNRSATIAFTAPPSNGGSPVTAYNAACSAGFSSIVTGTAASSPIVLAGMSNGTAYSCTVSASNQRGTGPLSASISVTPKDESIPVTQRTSITLQSDAGDYIGQGRNYSYTRSNANISVTANGGQFSVSIRGDQDWGGTFQLPMAIHTLQTGQYSGLQRYPFHDPIKGGLSWSGEGRGCNTLTGFFTVDGVAYVNGTLDSIILHFEQHCEGGQTALRGEVQWSARDTTMPGGPIDPPPAGLWTPAAGAVPASGNYVYLASDWGDYIGGGRTYTYTGGQISTSSSGGGVSVNVNAGSEWWYSTFRAMDNVNQLRRGYYGDLQRFPFHNPVKGGLDWSGTGRGCNTLTGWFVVDDIAYTNGTLSVLKLRFEQHCEGGSAALHGQINWTR